MTIDGYVLRQILKLLLPVTYKIFQNISFCGGDVGGSNDGMNAICNRPEETDDVIFGEDIETLRQHVCANLCAATSFDKFRENRNQPYK